MITLPPIKKKGIPRQYFAALDHLYGGLLINEYGETKIENLYVAGECAGGIHGRNRLMGNSLLDIIVFGRRAGKSAGSKSKNVIVKELTLLFQGMISNLQINLDFI